MKQRRKRYDVITICNLFPPQGGGLENAAYGLLQFLKKEKKLKCAAIFSDKKDKQYRKNGVDCYSFNSFKIFHGFYPFVGLKWLVTLVSLLSKNPDAKVMIYGRHFTSSLLGSFICKLMGRNYLYIDTGFEPTIFRQRFLNELINILDLTFFYFPVAFAKRHVIVSHTSKRFLANRYGRVVKNSEVILNGFEDEIVKKYTFEKKEKIIIFASRLVNVKNPNTVAKAFLNLAPKHNDWKFYFIGKGRCRFDDMDPLKIPDNIKYINHLIPQTKLHKLFAKSAIYINASLSEGLPLSIVEAGALGCILVMSDIEHNMEVASVASLNKYSFKAKDTEALISKLEAAMTASEDDPVEMHKNIAKKIQSVFSNSVVYSKYYEELMKLGN